LTSHSPQDYGRTKRASLRFLRYRKTRAIDQVFEEIDIFCKWTVETGENLPATRARRQLLPANSMAPDAIRRLFAHPIALLF